MHAAEHIYIHIPFCHRVCPYCAFFKHTPGATNMRGFVEAVVAETKLRLPEGAAPRTLYFGGGTPSMLSPTHLRLLVDGLRSHLDLGHLEEWSFEANPATFTRTKVRQWHALGITRVSLGAQSFNPLILKTLGREHKPEDIAASVNMLREEGGMRVNIDLMFCLPGLSLHGWRQTLEQTVALQPDHVSTYSLTIEPGTPFAASITAPPTEEEEVRSYSLAHELLTSAGFRHYEISNFAINDRERSLHNLSCWRGGDYTGLGPGACGTVCGVRYENAHDTTRYTASLAQGQLPPGSAEQLSPEQRRTELIALGLRTDEGIALSLVPPARHDVLRSLADEGLCTLSNDRLILSPRGFLLADEIVLQII